jgi:hypothetical protein
MLLQNTLFRCGGAAVCLTNKKSMLFRAKYAEILSPRYYLRDDLSEMISPRWRPTSCLGEGGMTAGTFSHRYPSTTFLTWQVPDLVPRRPYL